ncbi:MAG: hypothetical protein M4579_002519 [Chaenotheca gracillima]|nr:MAG: hypothetical protein M4579_002519 [Chaenotheca gracillima]
MDIPVIDVASVNSQTGRELVDAAEKYGFIFIKNRGLDISTSEVDRIFELSRKFFSSPQEEKAQCRITPDNKGWSAMHREILDQGNQVKGDFKEAFNFGDFISGRAQQPLPPALVPHEEELSHFASACRDVCMKILRLFALGLEIEPSEGGEDWFSTRHDISTGEPTGSILRLLHYPPLPPSVTYDPTTDIRAGAHSDYGSITLLFQRPGQPGLEILTPDDPPKWAPVPVSPEGTESDAGLPILVNIGDMLSDWTEGLLKSTVHRVVFPTPSKSENGTTGPEKGFKDRYSIAYFFHPLDSTPLVAVPSERVKRRSEEKQTSKAGKVLTAKEHLEKRLAATYGWEKK